MRFHTRHCKEIYIAENNKGVVDSVYRRFSMTAKACIEMFGEANVGATIAKKAKKDGMLMYRSYM